MSEEVPAWARDDPAPSAAPAWAGADSGAKGGGEDDFRLGPGASSVVRPIGRAVGETLGMFDRPRDMAQPGGGTVHVPSIAQEFEQFMDKYTTKPTTTLGRAAETAGSMVVGGMMPMGLESKAAREGEALVKGASEKVGEVARDVTKRVGEAVTQKTAATREATRWGFQVSPRDMEKAPFLSRVAQKVAGSDIDRKVSTHNVERFNELGRNFINVPDGTFLDEKTFQGVRAKYGQPFERLRLTPPISNREVLQVREQAQNIGADLLRIEKGTPPGTVDQEVLNDLTRIKGTFMQQTIDSNVAIDLVKMWRQEAGKNFATNTVQSWYKATFQRQAADIMENLLEKHANSIGLPDLMKDIRNARKMIARSYALEDATNTATGNVNAHILARMSENDNLAPLDGEAKAIADFAKAHPFSSKPIDKMGYGTEGGIGKLRFLLAAGAFAAGHPQYAMAIAAEEALSGVGARVAQSGAQAGAETAAKQAPRRKFNTPGAAAVGARQLQERETGQ